MGNQAQLGISAKGYNSLFQIVQYFQQNTLKSESTFCVRDRELFTIKEAMQKRKQEAFNPCQSSVCFSNQGPENLPFQLMGCLCHDIVLTAPHSPSIEELDCMCLCVCVCEHLNPGSYKQNLLPPTQHPFDNQITTLPKKTCIKVLPTPYFPTLSCRRSYLFWHAVQRSFLCQKLFHKDQLFLSLGGRQNIYCTG